MFPEPPLPVVGVVRVVGEQVSNWMPGSTGTLLKVVPDVGLPGSKSGVQEPSELFSFFDFSSTPRASFSLCSSSFFAIAESESPIICAARMPALVAPGFPIATVATGMPAGICTVASKESIPGARWRGSVLQ
jgi:hypothetical protein